MLELTMLTLIYLLHEYVARNFIPYYNLKFEAREAANSFVFNWKNRRKHDRGNELYDGIGNGECETSYCSD